MATPQHSDLDFGNQALIVGLDATEARQGVAEVATTTEVTAGVDDTRMVTPLKLAQLLAALGLSAQIVFTPQTGTAATGNIAGGSEVNITGVIGFTVPVGSSGKARIEGLVHVAMGATLVGTNTVEVRMYLDGVLVPAATRTKAISGVVLSLDSEPVTIVAYASALASGAHTFQIRAFRPAGAASTASGSGLFEANVTSLA